MTKECPILRSSQQPVGIPRDPANQLGGGGGGRTGRVSKEAECPVRSSSSLLFG